MADNSNKDIVTILKSIDKRLENINYYLADIKREMPKVPYYGDMLQDIAKAVERQR